jgi:hypothetical protein
MLVEALIPLLAMAILLKVAANWELILIIDMKEAALIAFLACAL